MYFFFFFQAEDGIRDLIVTGVQTCALPISRDLAASARRELARTRDRSPSRSVSDLRSCAYSAKSPFSQLMAAASSSMASRFLRTWRVSPMTPRSAWNCANEDSSRVEARARPAQPVRLTALL